ncbi:hypothetical protein [Hymenobacter cellulosilyticus]|uniref:Uncharacterized protein n=1 Tax=Hymenobacter cellulosilyticus TaxID=2932248 RepID=A0A8T9QC37_9BACT|nr:hypothetical protein [Hymenobacter cellulosilyticus]UOQ74512.1 hypothetical protein MUN79_11885 [Hymenobacter cellulosilyticus]
MALYYSLYKDTFTVTMREIKTVLIGASLYFTGCNIADQELHFKPPVQINPATYQTLMIRFKLNHLGPAPSYWGGLMPSYPIADAFSSHEECIESSWPNKGMMSGCSKILVKKDTLYSLINTREELQQTYAPITSKSEALSYASIYFEYFPITTSSFFEESFFYRREKIISRADSLEKYFIVHLYDQKVFGCGPHPYYYSLIKVFADGSVQELQKNEAFRDPKKDDWCID